MSISIDIGCGKSKAIGAIGLDCAKLKGVDIICDLNCGLPFKDNSVDTVFTSHFLEHVNDLISMMEEIYRVTKPNAKINIVVPYWNSTLAFQDPTHKRFFTDRTFDYFTKDPKRHRPQASDYGFKCDFNILRVKLIYLRLFTWMRYFHLHHFLPINTIDQIEVSLTTNKSLDCLA